MAQDVTITLTAKDGTTTVFRQAGAAAQKMGQEIEQAGTRGAKSLDGWSKAAKGIGTGLGALTLLATRANAESEASQARLDTAIQNTGHTLDEYATSIDAASKKALQLGFDDEDAADAIASMTTATGDAQRAISDLAIAEDVSRARKIDLASAAALVTAAEQGRYGALARMGIQIDATASSEEALAALQDRYAGSAQAYSETSAAGFDRLQTSAGNALESLGSHLESAQVPLLALSGAATGLGFLGDAFRDIGGSAKLASVGMSALEVATGPVGLALAVAGAGVALYELATRESDAEAATRRLKGATDDYTASIVSNTTALVNAGAFQTVDATSKALTSMISAGGQAADRIGDLSDAMSVLKSIDPTGEQGGAFDSAIWAGVTGSVDDYSKSMLAASDANHDGFITMSEMSAALQVAQSQFVITADQAGRLEQDLAKVNAAAADPQLAGGELARDAQKIVTDLQNNVIGVDEALSRLDALSSAEGLQSYNLALRAATAGTHEHTAAVDRLNRAEQANVDASQASTDAATAEAVARLHAADATTTTLDATRRYMAEQNILGEAVNAAKAEVLDQTQAMADYARSAAEASTTTAVLHSGISVILGGLDTLGGGVKKVDDSLRGLVGATGEWGTIDDLVSAGAISWGEYNAAVGAADSATASAESTQTSLNTILAMQAPLLADLAADQATYVAGLADLPAAQQLVALGYMDSAESAKALEMQTLALDAANGKLGEGGKGFAKDIIRGAAEADPVMKAMLQDMGLISVGAEGTIKVTFPPEGQSELAALNETLKQLEGTFEVLLKVDINDDGVIGYEPPPLPDAKQKVEVDDGEAVGIMLSWGRDHQPGASKVPVEVDDATAVATMLSWGADHTPDPVKVPVTVSDADAVDKMLSWGGQSGATGGITVPIAADTSAADATVMDTIARWGGLQVDPVELDANPAMLQGAVSAAAWSLSGLAALKTVPEIDANPAMLQGAVSAASWSLSGLAQLSTVPVIDADNGPADLAIGNTWNSLAAVGGASATPTVNLADNASGAIGGITGSLDGLDGRVVTTYVQAVSLGAGIGPHATGGVVIRGGEHGPEAVTIPGSAMRAILPGDGLYAVPSGSNVTPAGATDGLLQSQRGRRGLDGITISGNVYVMAADANVHDAINSAVLAQARR